MTSWLCERRSWTCSRSKVSTCGLLLVYRRIPRTAAEHWIARRGRFDLCIFGRCGSRWSSGHGDAVGMDVMGSLSLCLFDAPIDVGRGIVCKEAEQSRTSASYLGDGKV